LQEGFMVTGSKGACTWQDKDIPATATIIVTKIDFIVSFRLIYRRRNYQGCQTLARKKISLRLRQKEGRRGVPSPAA
jgi:hypothetical protein